MSSFDPRPTRRPNGLLTVEEITDAIDRGEIDTVLVVFPDLAGSWKGKRMTGHFFLDDTLHHGIEACNYLIATDVEMNVLPGYRYANWEAGYGDMRCVPDLPTMRIVPWLEKTAMVICDIVDENGAPVEVSPRQVLKRQLARAAAMGLTVKTGAELEFFLFKESYEAAASKGYRDLTPDSNTVQDYHILQTTKDEHLIRAIRNGMEGAGVPIECSKGEAGFAQHEINLRYSEALEMADRLCIYKNGAKEIAALAGRAITFMAKYSMADVGSSCHVHSSIWDAETGRSVVAGEGGPAGMSTLFSQYLAGNLATAKEFSWLFAPTVNSYKRYQPGSWAPTAVAWGTDNRTCGFRMVGHGQGMRVETRVPGADANPYLAFAGVVAGGLHGIENKLELEAPFAGNAYESKVVPRIPWNIVEAIESMEGSTAAQAAFGDDVVYHFITTAKHEWAQFNTAVTDWELRRNFERW
jgi:glutamine synthetase